MSHTSIKLLDLIASYFKIFTLHLISSKLTVWNHSISHSNQVRNDTSNSKEIYRIHESLFLLFQRLSDVRKESGIPGVH